MASRVQAKENPLPEGKGFLLFRLSLNRLSLKSAEGEGSAIANQLLGCVDNLDCTSNRVSLVNRLSHNSSIYFVDSDFDSSETHFVSLS
jgi:hypothetical protein